MAIKKFGPYTPSRRNMTGSDFAEITKTSPEKSLVVSLKKNSGRNNQGKITVRHRGGGSRRKYRVIDFKRKKDGVPAKVVSIEYDPNRTANIALITYADGEKSYILAPEGLKVGMIRPITLWPFPKAPLAAAAEKVKSFLCVELNMGQMKEDVELAIQCRRPVDLCCRVGGMIPAPDEVLAHIKKLAEGEKA